MSERITLNELEKIKKAPNNLFIDDKNNIFLQKGMFVKKEELELLKKWKIETFILKDRIDIGIENFTSLFLFEKDKVAKTYKHLLNRIENYYNSVSKQYKLGLPEFQDELEGLFNMESSQMYYFLFYLHSYQKTNRLEEVVLRSSVYALFIAKRMGKNLEECNNVFEHAIISEIGYIEKSEKTMESTLKEMADVLDFQYLKQHVSFGFKTAIEKLGHEKKSAVNILTHHDYIDGSGFNKITGDKLSLESLIITVAQEFTYLTTEFIQEKSPIFDFSNGILQLVRKKNDTKKKCWILLFPSCPFTHRAHCCI